MAMDLPGSSNSITNFCELCNTCPQKYKCPRCSIPYCSLECYKSASHIDCSEDFYKECVETEMKSQANNPENRNKMMEILKRFHLEDLSENPVHANEESDDDNEEDTWAQAMAFDEANDSDDDDEVPDLAERIKNVNMDNADELWGILTDAERQEFEAMIRNAEDGNLLPHWMPWWAQTVEDKLVQDVNETGDVEFKKTCPQIIEIASINKIDNFDDKIVYNYLHIFYAYVVMSLHYNGEHQSSPFEAISIFLELNHVIGNSQVFGDQNSAATSVLEKAVDYELLPDYGEPKEVTEAIKQIIKGPNKKYQSYYMIAALSDLHHLFTKVQSRIGETKQKPNSQFPKRLKNQIEFRSSKLTKEYVKMCIDTVECYLSWITKHGVCMLDVQID